MRHIFGFVLFMRDMFPINVLKAVQNVPEVVRTFCATANPVQVIVAQTDQGRGILGVVNGFASKDVKTKKNKAKRAILDVTTPILSPLYSGLLISVLHAYHP